MMMRPWLPVLSPLPSPMSQYKKATGPSSVDFVASKVTDRGPMPLVTLAAWFAGVSPFGKWPNPHNPNARAE